MKLVPRAAAHATIRSLMGMQGADLEVVGTVSFLDPLAPDDLRRAAEAFSSNELRPGERIVFGTDAGTARLIVLVRGDAELTLREGSEIVSTSMDVGGWHGLDVLAGAAPRRTTVETKDGATLATLDKSGFERMLAEVPAIALPLCAAL